MHFLFNDLPDGFDIGKTHIQFYSLTMLTGFIIAIISALWRTKLKGGDVELVEWFIFIVVPSSIFGARTWYYITNAAAVNTNYESNHFLAYLGFVEGQGWHGLSGLAIQGGVGMPVLLSVPYFLYFGKKRHHSYWLYFDAILPSVLLGQIIGRWGNFFNHEVLGPIVSEQSLSWLPHWIVNNLHYHGEDASVFRAPFFLYEALANLVGFILIVSVVGRLRFFKAGSAGSFYLIIYGIVRSSMELERDPGDILYVSGIPISFVIGLLSLFGGLAFLAIVNFWAPKTRKPDYWYGEVQLHRHLMSTDMEYKSRYIATREFNYIDIAEDDQYGIQTEDKKIEPVKIIIHKKE